MTFRASQLAVLSSHDIRFFDFLRAHQGLTVVDTSGSPIGTVVKQSPNNQYPLPFLVRHACCSRRLFGGIDSRGGERLQAIVDQYPVSSAIWNFQQLSKELKFMSKTLVQMTAEIIQSQITSKQMTTDEIKTALNDTFRTLQALQNAESKETADSETESAPDMPQLDPKKSIQKNKVVCLECGQEFKMLSPKHLKSHGLTTKEYRKKYGFTARQPLCAKTLSERRSLSGKERGIPENLRIAIEARTKKK